MTTRSAWVVALALALAFDTTRAATKPAASQPTDAGRNALTVTIEAPEELLIGDALPSIEVAFSSSHSPIYDVAIELDSELLSHCRLTASSASCLPIDVLEPGSHTLVVTVTDMAGNVGTATRAFVLVYDRANPTLTITSPAERTVTRSSTVVITGTVSDDVGIREVRAGSTLATVIDGQFRFELPLLPGYNDIAVQAFDLIGKQTMRRLVILREPRSPAPVHPATPADTPTRKATPVPGRARDEVSTAPDSRPVTPSDPSTAESDCARRLEVARAIIEANCPDCMDASDAALLEAVEELRHLRADCTEDRRAAMELLPLVWNFMSPEPEAPAAVYVHERERDARCDLAREFPEQAAYELEYARRLLPEEAIDELFSWFGFDPSDPEVAFEIARLLAVAAAKECALERYAELANAPFPWGQRAREEMADEIRILGDKGFTWNAATRRVEEPTPRSTRRRPDVVLGLVSPTTASRPMYLLRSHYANFGYHPPEPLAQLAIAEALLGVGATDCALRDLERLRFDAEVGKRARVLYEDQVGLAAAQGFVWNPQRQRLEGAGRRDRILQGLASAAAEEGTVARPTTSSRDPQ